MGNMKNIFAWSMGGIIILVFAASIFIIPAAFGVFNKTKNSFWYGPIELIAFLLAIVGLIFTIYVIVDELRK